MSLDDKNQILDEAMDSIAALVSGGLEMVSGAGAEAKAVMRTRFERLIEELDLVNGEKLEVAQAQIDKLRAHVDTLEARLAAIEKKS